MNKLISTRLMTAITIVLIFQLFCFSSSSLAAEELSWEWDDSDSLQYFNQYQSPVESWELMKDQYGIQLYLGNIQGTDIKAFKGVTRINSSVNSLLAVMSHAEACPQWVHNCEVSFLVHDNGVRDRYVYQSYDLMFPVGKRDYLFYASLTQDPGTGTVTINMEATPMHCRNNPAARCKTINQSDNIMIQKSRGFYRLEPMPDGSTLVTWEQFTDPAGDLPIWIVNQLVLNVPFMTLKGLQDVVKEKQYQQANNILDKDTLLTGDIGE